MKILHVIQSLDPADGGPPMVAARVAAAQAGQGQHQVEIATVEYPGRSERIAAALKTVPGIINVNITYLRPQLPIERFASGRSQTQLRPLIQSADVVHLHGVWDRVLSTTAGLAHRLNKKYVITPHGMLDPWALAQSRWKKRIAMAIYYRRMLNRASMLHLLNADEHSLIAPLRLKPPIAVISNGVFLEEINPLPERGSFYKVHPEFDGKPYILFLSRLHYKKGLDILAEAFAITAKACPEVLLVVAGPDGGAQADFAARVKGHQLSDRVHITGPLYGPVKLAAFVDATCFCLPSRQEGFSLAITESLACGTPVVITNACHFPEVADNGAGLVVDLSPASIADALLKVIATAEGLTTMGKAGQQLILERYTWPKIARRMLSAYETILTGQNFAPASLINE